MTIPYTVLAATNDLRIALKTSESASNLNPLAQQTQEDTSSLTSLPSTVGPDMLATCLLTSGVLLAVGGTAKIRRLFHGGLEGKAGAMGHKRTGSTQVDMMSIGGAQTILARAFRVGLPFYASLKLGGVQTGLVILIALITDLMSLDQKSNPSSVGSLKRLLKNRRWTIAALLLQAVSDMAGLTSAPGLAGKFAGLLALCLCVLVLPPPFPIYNAEKKHITSPAEPPPSSGPSILTTLKEIPAASNVISPDPKVSSLIHTPDDTDLTLVAGTLIGLFALFIYFFSSIPSAGAFSVHLMGGGLLTICMAALSLTFTQPQSLRQSRGIGLLIGSLLSCSLLMVFGPGPPVDSLYQGALILLYSFAAIKDTHSSHSSSHHTHGHGHGHSHHNHQHHNDLSQISNYLLNYSQKWPLLHSILAEKDSRRIFYFMMYAHQFLLHGILSTDWR